MKIELTDLTPVKKSLSVEAEADEVSRETDSVLRRFASQARIPGFRPGKAPLDLVRKRYAKEIHDDVRDRLISKLYASATREKGLRPLGDPVLEELVHEAGSPFRFKTTFEVLPDIEPKSYRGVEAREAPAVVSDDDVAEALESLRQAHAKYVAEADRPAAAGDVLVADVEEHPEGEEPRRRERVIIEVGLPEQLPAFNEAVIGARGGSELAFTVRYPENHPGAAFRGKEVAYRLTVHEVKRKELSPLDDEFAKDLGEFDSLEALRARVRTDLEERKRRETRAAVRQSVLDKVLLENPVPLPDVLVDEEIHQRLEDAVRSMILHGVDPRNAELDWKALRDRQEEPARKVVHARLVLDAIAEKEGLAVDAGEVDARLRAEAERLGEPLESLRARLRKSGGLQALENQMVREKSLDFLTSVANIHRPE